MKVERSERSRFGEALLLLPRALLKRKMRGGTRLLELFAGHASALQSYRTPVPGGSLYVDLRNASGHSQIAEPTSIGAEHRIIKRCVRPGDVAYDIGANIGIFTVWLSSLVGEQGRVIAFEPNPALLDGLQRTAGILGNVDLIAKGLAEKDGTFEFFVPDDDTMGSMQNWTREEGGKVATLQCEVTTIDKIVAAGRIPMPDIIKCDIEGGEFHCFAGAKETLGSDNAPIVLFEANINSTRGYGLGISAAMEFLAGLDGPCYTFFRVCEPDRLEAISSIDFLHGNILAVPKLRLDRLDRQAADGWT